MSKSDPPLESKTLNFYRGDYARLREIYPQVGAAKVIRTLVRRHVVKMEARLASVGETNVKLEEPVEL